MRVAEDSLGCQYPRNTAILLQLIAQAENDVRAGRTVPQEEVFFEARKRLKLPKPE